MGRDFCFIGSEFPLQVGNQDFALDLLFFRRGLNCLVAVELKVGRFEPEYLGKLNFYLEAVDRDVRKPHERPTLGLLLCDEVVEYALRRSLSPAMIAEYKTQLPDKRMLAARLRDRFGSASDINVALRRVGRQPKCDMVRVIAVRSRRPGLLLFGSLAWL